MNFGISAAALGVALVAGASGAQAQTVITRQITDQPVETVITQQPAQTVQTTETVRTVQPVRSGRTVRRQVTTTRTITRQVVPAPTVVARTVTAAPRPLYDEVVAAPAVAAPVPAVAAIAPAPVVTSGYTEPFVYRYVYQPDRILVVDPNTGIAVQALPR